MQEGEGPGSGQELGDPQKRRQWEDSRDLPG